MARRYWFLLNPLHPLLLSIGGKGATFKPLKSIDNITGDAVGLPGCL